MARTKKAQQEEVDRFAAEVERLRGWGLELAAELGTGLRCVRDGSQDLVMAAIQMDRDLKATSKDECPHCGLPMELSGQSWVSQDGKVCCTRDCAVAVYAG
jgi:hypothetical protein